VSSHSHLQRTDDAVLYGAAFVATIASTLAVTTTVVSPGLSSRAVVAIAAGFGVSWAMHVRGIRSRTLPYLLLVIGLVALSPWWAQPQRFMTLIPAEFTEEPDFRIAGVLLVLATLRTFSLVTRGDLLFCAVPGISLFGVMAYRRPDSNFMALFWVFLAASALLIGYDHLLEMRARVAETAAERERTLRRDHLVATVALCVLCVVVASAAALPLRLAGERYRSQVMGGLAAVAPQRVGELPSYLLGGDRIDIGTGPVALGETEIMWIRTETPSNWRLKAYDYYDGRSWSIERKSEQVAGSAGEFDFSHLLHVIRRGEDQQRYEVHLTRGGDANIALSAPAVSVALRLQDRPHRPLPASADLDLHGTITIGSGEAAAFQFQRDDWYQVVAQPGAEVSGRTFGSTAIKRSGPFGLRRDSPVLARLVAQITEGLEPEDHTGKVGAIQRYLVDNCRYNAYAPPVPRTERDVVEYFLLKSPEGACDLFASALCVMCRLAGVPARLAVGYAPGEPGGRNTYIVREIDSHAWAEVWLEGTGWVTVDPTAGSVRAVRRQGRLAFLRAVTGFLRRNLRTIGVLAAIALALFLIAYLHPVTVRRSASLPMSSGPSADVITAYRRACRRLERAGYRRADRQTAVEYAAACRGRPALAGAWPLFEELTWLYIKARYARSGASAEDVERASAALSAMRLALRQAHRDAPEDHGS
jgi:hypothetical protein